MAIISLERIKRIFESVMHVLNNSEELAYFHKEKMEECPDIPLHAYNYYYQLGMKNAMDMVFSDICSRCSANKIEYDEFKEGSFERLMLKITEGEPQG